MKKRTLSLLLAIVMVISTVYACGITAAAASDGSSGENVSLAAISVSEAWGNPGENVDVELTVTDNPGIQGAIITVSWDERLTLVSTASGEAFSQMEYTAPSQYVASGTNFLWDSNEVENAVDGVILILTFSVSETVQNNEILPVKVTYIKGDVVDGEDNDVILDITDGSVRAISYIPGDVNGDGRVNTRDLVMLRQYISDGCTVNPQGYNANVVTDACDVNGDGRINTRDLVRLRQYISDGSKTDPEGYNVVLKPAKMPECSHPDMQATAAKATTCIEPGNIAYWHCDKCGKYFSDSEGKNEISEQKTIAPANGHTEVTDAPVSPTYESTGLTEGSHCSVCGAVLVAQTEIPKLEAVSHSVTYMNTKSAEIPVEKMKYNEHEGLYDLPTPEVEGYIFNGWIDVNTGKSITRIEKGTTGNIELYADWELIKYKITYDLGNAKQHENNPTEYTVESPTITLAGLTMKAHVFVGWFDVNTGKQVEWVGNGKTGNIELKPKWRLARNTAYSYKEIEDSGRTPKFDEITYLQNEVGNGFAYIFYLGYLDNVVLDTVSTPYTHTGSSYKKTLSTKTVTSSEFVRSVSDVASRSSSWQNEKAISKSISDSLSYHFGVEAGMKDVCKVSSSFDCSRSVVDAKQFVEMLGGSSEVEHSLTESQAFSWSVENETSQEYSFDDTDPIGTYRLVNCCTVHVFAVAQYDAETDNLYVYNLNYIDGQVTQMLDYSKTSMFDEETDSILDFTFPADKVADAYFNSYSVSFDGNQPETASGQVTGVPSTSFWFKNQTSTLPSAPSLEGWIFNGWYTDPSCTPETKVGDADQRLIAANLALKNITLYAGWRPWTWNIVFNANKPDDESAELTGSMDEMQMSFDKSDTLKPNQFKLTFYNFIGWALTPQGAVKYKDCEEVRNITPENDNGEVTLYAVWEPCTYKVYVDYAGGDASAAYYEVKYKEKISLPNPTRAGWRFAGWQGMPSDNIMPAEDIYITATWGCLSHTWSSQEIYTITDDAVRWLGAPTLSGALDMSFARANNCQIEITVSFHVKEINNGYQCFAITKNQRCTFIKDSDWKDPSDPSILYCTNGIETAGTKKGEGDFSATAYVYANSLTDDAVYTAFCARGSGDDDWELSNLRITVRIIT